MYAQTDVMHALPDHSSNLVWNLNTNNKNGYRLFYMQTKVNYSLQNKCCSQDAIFKPNDNA